MSSRYRTVDCDERKITWDQRDKVIDESANLDFPASAHFTFTTHFRLAYLNHGNAQKRTNLNFT